MPNVNSAATAPLPPATLDALNRAFTCRYHSLARYILDSGPYVGTADGPTLDIVRRLADWDHRQAERLADLIEGHEAIPQVTPYEHDVPELNYLALAYLRGILAAKLAGQADDAERSAAAVGACPPARAALARLARNLREWAELLGPEGKASRRN
jgi:hypothetical protein